MDSAHYSLLSILLIMVGGFLFTQLPIEITALTGLLALVACGFIRPDEAFSGFASPTIITMAAVFFISGALRETGVSYRIGDWLFRRFGGRERSVVLSVLIMSALFSAFMNNVVAGALLLPSVIRLCQISGVAPSKTLIPLAFGCTLGGTLTLLGTPPNMIASDLLRQNGFAPLSFFSFFPIGVVILVVCGGVILAFSKRLLPANPMSHRILDDPDLAALYQIKEKLFAVRVPPLSPLAGQTLERSNLGKVLGCRVVRIDRVGSPVVAPTPHEILQVGDRLILRGNTDNLEELKRKGEVAAEGGEQQVSPTGGRSPLSDLVVESDIQEAQLETDEIGLLEVVLSPRSGAVGRTLRQLNFRSQYNFIVLAIWRAGESIRANVSEIVLQHGDALLLQGPRSKMSALARDRDFVVLSRIIPVLSRQRRAPLVIMAFLCTIVFPWMNLMPIQIAAVLSALLVVIIGATTMEEGYRDVEWRVLTFTAALMPLGIAFDRSGLAHSLTSDMLSLVGQENPLIMLIALGVAASALSQLVDSVPAVIVLSPIALTVARVMHVEPHPFILAVALGASNAFLLPVSAKVNLLMMGAGGYVPKDYIRLGALVTVAMFVAMFAAIALLYPLS